MMPNGADIKYFLCVCDHKNISRASDILGISQPSLSLAIKRLEQIAGVELFIRSKNGVVLTSQGEAFRLRSLELMDLWQNISEEIKKRHDEVSGRYVIGAHISVALSTLPLAISHLMKSYPSLELSLEHGLSRIITDQVIAFAIDFGIVVNPTPHPDLVLRLICEDRVGFYVANSSHESEVLIYDPNLLQAQSLLKTIKDHGLNFKRTITSSSLELIARLAKEGTGVAILPEKVQKTMDENLGLWRPELPQFIDRHFLIYRADVQNNPAALMLARKLKALLLGQVQ